LKAEGRRRGEVHPGGARGGRQGARAQAGLLRGADLQESAPPLRGARREGSGQAAAVDQAGRPAPRQGAGAAEAEAGGGRRSRRAKALVTPKFYAEFPGRPCASGTALFMYTFPRPSSTLKEAIRRTR